MPPFYVPVLACRQGGSGGGVAARTPRSVTRGGQTPPGGKSLLCRRHSYRAKCVQFYWHVCLTSLTYPWAGPSWLILTSAIKVAKLIRSDGSNFQCLQVQVQAFPLPTSFDTAPMFAQVAASRTAQVLTVWEQQQRAHSSAHAKEARCIEAARVFLLAPQL